MTFRQSQYPAEWNIKTIGTASEVVNGGTPKTGVSEYWNGKHLWITPAEMGKRQSPYVENTERKLSDAGLNNSSAQLLPPNSVILSSRAPIGHLVINTKPMATNQGCKGLIPSSILYYKFLYYYLYHNVDLLNSLGTGATFKELSGGKLKEIPIPLPPLPEQKRIVGILDQVFAAISTAKANAEKNLANARELFESYLQGVFANPGDGWEEKKLGEVCELKSGTTISSSLERNEGDVLYTKIADMNLPENLVEIHTSSRFADSNEIKKNQIIPEGAIIFPKRGGAIATNKKRKIVKPTIVDLNTMAIIPGKKIDKDFLYFWFQLIDLNDISNGTSIPQINNYSFDDVYIPYPISLSEQRRIVTKLDALSDETKKLEAIYQQKIAYLEELKKSVLQKAFAGELPEV